MPARKLIAEKMAEFLSALSNPNRIRIIEELYIGEHDVNRLQTILGTSHSTVSQHLSVLKAHKIVKHRKEGNRAFYRLVQPELASWLLQGLSYIGGGLQSDAIIRSAVDEAKTLWKHHPNNLSHTKSNNGENKP